VGGVVGLDAVILIVKDLEAQKSFYRDVLNLDIIDDYGDAVFFSCGEQKLALFSRGHHPRGTERLEGASKGISHLEFRIRACDYEVVRRSLTDGGHEVLRENFEDADGNLFHFNVVDG
jgi:catechol 2,3-dioxygenase-like lactoylglutathione lyase family enzyme